MCWYGRLASTSLNTFCGRDAVRSARGATASLSAGGCNADFRNVDRSVCRSGHAATVALNSLRQCCSAAIHLSPLLPPKHQYPMWRLPMLFPIISSSFFAHLSPKNSRAHPFALGEPDLIFKTPFVPAWLQATGTPEGQKGTINLVNPAKSCNPVKSCLSESRSYKQHRPSSRIPLGALR